MRMTSQPRILAGPPAGPTQAWQPVGLLVLSLVFYALVGTPTLVALLLLTAGVTFLTARALRSSRSATVRVSYAVGIGWSLTVLVVLKMSPVALSPAQVPGWLRTILLPASTVGVSYYGLQTLSYLTDVRRGQIEPEQNPLGLTLSLAFFAKLLQGPIERCRLLIPQLGKPIRFVYDDARWGLILIAVGLIKKLVVADSLAPFVNAAFDSPEAYQGLPLIIAVYSYSFQIYFDFSGYTDIALGAARLFGIILTDNFDRPYWSSSVPVFWSRWHITLSNWLRDYLFMPIVYRLGRRLEPHLPDYVNDRLCYAIAALGTMSVCGLWHGPRLTFLLWGAVHGIFLVVSNLTRRVRDRTWRRLPHRWRRLRAALAVVITFNLVTLTWILFRAGGLAEAWDIVANSSRCFSYGADWSGKALSGSSFGLLGGGLWLAVERRLTRDELLGRLLRCPVWFRWAIYYGMVLAVLLFGATRQPTFIYAQF